MGEQKVKKKSVVDNIIELLIEDIVSGKYPIGSKLPNEYELIALFEVSRNSFREAIKIMSTLGIVEVKRGDGTYVCTEVNSSAIDRVAYSMMSYMSASEDLIELREIIDETTVRYAMNKITDEDIKYLEENIEKMRIAIKFERYEVVKMLDYEFHLKLIDSCKNPLFTRMSQSLYTIFKNSISDNLDIEGADSLAPTYHQNIVNCLKEKNIAAIPKVVADSLITWRNQL